MLSNCSFQLEFRKKTFSLLITVISFPTDHATRSTGFRFLRLKINRQEKRLSGSIGIDFFLLPRVTRSTRADETRYQGDVLPWCRCTMQRAQMTSSGALARPPYTTSQQIACLFSIRIDFLAQFSHHTHLDRVVIGTDFLLHLYPRRWRARRRWCRRHGNPPVA